MRRPVSCAALALALAGCGRHAAPPPTPAAAQPVKPATVYHCADGRTVQARYDGRRAELQVGGRRYALAAAMSASGARYVGEGLQWWTKGLEHGRLSVLKPGEQVAADPGVACSTSAAEVAPPPPGAPGGLPDDRTPLAEGPVSPKSPQAAARVVERYFALLEAGKPAEAAALRSDGRPPDLSPYRSYHAQVGAPGRPEGAAGSIYVEVPVVIYGRMKSGAALHQSGKAVLRRVNDVPGATAAQLRWRIERIELGAG
jgi:membrane-bound inhibitor of C-type lysozyme